MYSKIYKVLAEVLGYNQIIEEGWKQKTRQRSSRRFGGQNVFNSLPN